MEHMRATLLLVVSMRFFYCKSVFAMPPVDDDDGDTAGYRGFRFGDRRGFGQWLFERTLDDPSVYENWDLHLRWRNLAWRTGVLNPTPLACAANSADAKSFDAKSPIYRCNRLGWIHRSRHTYRQCARPDGSRSGEAGRSYVSWTLSYV